jgi:alkylated DNA repair dioxygenase AlkB
MQIITGHEQKGLSLHGEFITPDEEQALIARFSAVSNPNATQRDKNRQSVRRYGSNKSYNSYMVSNEIPDYLQVLCDRLLAMQLLETAPDSVSINEYLKGQTIHAHVDSKASGRVITVLSLQSPATMPFERELRTFSIKLPPRSVVQLRGEIRTLWTHAISPVPGRRYSLVFRCSHDVDE